MITVAHPEQSSGEPKAHPEHSLGELKSFTSRLGCIVLRCFYGTVSTVNVISSRSVNLLYLFLGRLSPLRVNQYFVHILMPVAYKVLRFHDPSPLKLCCRVLFVLRFYGPVNPMRSCRVPSVYLTSLLLGRLSSLSG